MVSPPTARITSAPWVPSITPPRGEPTMVGSRPPQVEACEGAVVAGGVVGAVVDPNGEVAVGVRDPGGAAVGRSPGPETQDASAKRTRGRTVRRTAAQGSARSHSGTS